jgi:hypothetical protein
VKPFVSLLCFVACASCAVVDHDVTNQPVAANLSGKCFVTQQTLYLVNTRELSISDGAGACPHGDSALFGLFKCGFKLNGTVPAGTEIIVTKVTDEAMGESGRCWNVQGRFKDARLSPSEIDIPSCNFHSFSKSWLNNWIPTVTYQTGEKLEFTSDAVRPCDSSSAP